MTQKAKNKPLQRNRAIIKTRLRYEAGWNYLTGNLNTLKTINRKGGQHARSGG